MGLFSPKGTGCNIIMPARYLVNILLFNWASTNFSPNKFKLTVFRYSFGFLFHFLGFMESVFHFIRNVDLDPVLDGLKWSFCLVTPFH